MPTFIPDRLKTPGDFPSIDANDNQIRGFGFFADNTARTALAEDFRCEGYLAFMKDTDQFKQYNNSAVDNTTWSNDSNWVLLEGQQTDTFWAADADGAGIYFSNQVIVGASAHTGAENLFVNGSARVAGSLKADIKLETPLIHTSSGLDIVLNTDESNTAGDDFILKYRALGSGGTERNALDISPYAATPSITFGNIVDDFKFDHFSSSFSEFRTFSGNANETGFKFTDFAGAEGVMLFRTKTNDSYLELSDGGRKITTAPHTYKVSSTVEGTAEVTHGVEMLMPSSVTGDWEFNHLGNKNFVFKTSTSGTPKLQAKFHSASNGVVSIGSANYYAEYNGLQPSTIQSALQPKLFIVNDPSSTVGIRVQSGNTSEVFSADGNLRTQPVLFTEVRDDGFYISRTTTGPRYNTSTSDFESGNISAVIGMRRGPGNGNSLALFARNNLYFFSNDTNSFQVTGDPNAVQRDLKVFSPDGSQAFTLKVRNDDEGNGNISLTSDNIGEFLIARGSESLVEVADQRFISLNRGATLSTKQFSTDNALLVNSFGGKYVDTDGNIYNTEQDLIDAGATEDNTVNPTTAGIATADAKSFSVDGRTGHTFAHKKLGVGVDSVGNSYKIQTNGRVLAKIPNAYDNIGRWAYNIERFGSTGVVGAVGLRADGDIVIGGFNNSQVTIAKHVSDGTMDTEVMGRFTVTGLGLGIEDPLAKLHVFSGGVAIGDVASYNGALSTSHNPGEIVGNLFIKGGGLITNGGTNIIDSSEIHTNSNSRSIQWKPGSTESYRQAVLETNNSSGIAFRTDNRNTDYNFGKYGFSITDNPAAVGTTVDKPLYIKPRFPAATNDGGYTGGGNDGSGNVNQSLVHPLYFHYADAPSTLENVMIRTQVNDAKGASYDYGLDYAATATQGDTGNPFTANKTRLKISATFPFAESQTDGDGLHTSLSGNISNSEASIEIRNAFETGISGGSFANENGTLNTALFVGGQRFFEPRSRNSTKMYGFGGISFTRAANYGTTGDLSPEDGDLVNSITTDVTGGTAGSYVLSTSNSGEITLSSSTYDTSVDGELSLKVTLNAADNISAVEIIAGGDKLTSGTGFRSGDTITIPATKLGSSSTAAVITLSNDSFVTDGATVSMSFTHRHTIGIGAGNTSIVSNDTNTNFLNLGAGGSFHLARTAAYQAYRDHWFKHIEGREIAQWSVIQGGFLKHAKLMVGYSNDQQKNHDGSASINTANYGTAAFRVVASPNGMRVGNVAIASNSSSVLKFAEADLDTAGFTDESSTWGVDYDTDGGWYIGMPIYVSSTDGNHMVKQVRPDGVFQYNSGSDTSTFQRRIVVGFDNSNRQMTLDSALTTNGGDVLVDTRTESDLIRCRNIMGRDMFVVKSNGRLDLENGLIKMRTADYTPLSTHIGSDECIIYWDGTNLKVAKGGSGTTIIA